MVETKPAATIKIIREKPEGGIEVLLLRRNKKLKFAPKFWVFPGGKIDPNEIENTSSEMDAALQAAVRETMEEASLNVDLRDLSFYTGWTTPENEPYRYKTYFFHAQVPYDDSEVKVDNSEILEHRWYTPTDALNAASNKELILLPPTYMSLLRIRKCQDYKCVKKEWSRSKPIFVLPKVEAQDGVMHCMYEGDAGYEQTNSDQPGSRHRLIADYPNGSFQFLHEDCKSHFPISGGHHILE